MKIGLTLDDVAEMMTCSTSKISRLETGKGVPKVPDVRELMRIYGVTSETESDMLLRLVKDGREHGWWEPLTDGVAPERFVMDMPSRYPAMETEAVSISSFDISLLHGLLQIPDYTRAVMHSLLSQHPGQEIDRLVELRRRRQQALFREQLPLALSVIIDEGILHRVVGSRAIMAAQLEALLERSHMSNVDIRVLSFDSGFHRAHNGSFVVLELGEEAGGDVVYIEGHAGDTYLEGVSDVDLYKDVLLDVTGLALDPDASRALVGRCLEQHAHRGEAPPT
jgi:transcriptional regulator with XRE-family HTH domain